VTSTSTFVAESAVEALALSGPSREIDAL